MEQAKVFQVDLNTWCTSVTTLLRQNTLVAQSRPQLSGWTNKLAKTHEYNLEGSGASQLTGLPAFLSSNKTVC